MVEEQNSKRAPQRARTTPQTEHADQSRFREIPEGAAPLGELLDSRTSLVLSWRELNESTKGRGCRLSRPGQPYYRRQHWHNAGGVSDGVVLQGAAHWDQYVPGAVECPGEYLPGLRDGCRTLPYSRSQPFCGGKYHLRLDGDGLWIGERSPPAPVATRFPGVVVKPYDPPPRWCRPEEASLEALTELAPHARPFLKMCSSEQAAKAQEESRRRARAARSISDPEGEGVRW